MSMSTELIISIISLIVSANVGIFTILANIRISQINNTEKLQNFRREITGFELQFKDDTWLSDLIEFDRFRLYSPRAQRRIIKWWDIYKKQHPEVIIKSVLKDVDLKSLGRPNPLYYLGSLGRSSSDSLSPSGDTDTNTDTDTDTKKDPPKDLPED